jgi:small-conductance mechanosensitive channel
MGLARQLKHFVSFTLFRIELIMDKLDTPFNLPPSIEAFSKSIPDVLWNTIIVALAVLVALLIKFLITRLLKHYLRLTEFSLMRSMLENLGRPINYFVPLFILNLFIPLMRMNKIFYPPLDKAVEISLTIAFASLLINSLKVFEDYIYHQYDLNKDDNLKERKVRTQLQFMRKFLIGLIVLVTIAIILLSFDTMRKIGTSLLTGVGISGIIVGFAAQKSLANLLAGFQIAFTQPLRIDDVLVVEGEWGRVEDITLTYVVLNIWDQRRLILPINYFIEKPFQNWTRTTSQLLGTVFLYMDYTLPVDTLRNEFDRLLKATNLWDKRASAIQITDAREHTMEIRALMSARNSSDAFDLRCYIRENLILFIQQNYPQALPKNRAEVDAENFRKNRGSNDLSADGVAKA